jgi:hypothetical protein
MLDPRAGIRSRVATRSVLESIEHCRDGRISLRVHTDPPSGRPCALDQAD